MVLTQLSGASTFQRAASTPPAENPTNSDGQEDSYTLTWNDEKTAKVLQGAVGVVPGAFVGALPGFGQLYGAFALAGVAGVVAYKAGDALGRGLTRAVFRSESFRNDYQKVIGQVLGATAAAVAALAVGSVVVPLAFGSAGPKFLYGPSMLIGAAGGAGIGVLLPRDAFTG